MLDLRPEWLSLVRRILAEYLPDAEVLAYGSRVNGTSHDGSDLDLVVRNPVEPGRSYPRLNELRRAFSESNLPILVDILDWAAIPEEFRAEISEKMETVQEGRGRCHADGRDAAGRNG
ncbi:nucleotidyltransferase domain-containing protein [Geobacter sp.]|uniref:nucleotidyltransferase family protein n=1 Tax=Geobacter sp. TaxID=46610 RepID=UPI00261EA528|nr:nucleotidyltransferase domain-containing protein [Geobacter sp.]